MRSFGWFTGERSFKLRQPETAMIERLPPIEEF